MKKAGPHPPLSYFAVLPHDLIQAGLSRPASKLSPFRGHIGMQSTHFLLAFGTNLAIEFPTPVSENGLTALSASFAYVEDLCIRSLVKKNVPRHMSGDILARLSNCSLSIGTVT